MASKSNYLKMDIEDLMNHTDQLKKAIEGFEPYSQDFIEGVNGLLEPMNADFISSIEKALSNMEDTKAPTLLRKLNNYEAVARKIITENEALDKELSRNITLEESQRKR